MSKMIKMSMFAFDEDRKMISRINAEQLVHPQDFDPAWVTEDALKEVFREELPAVKVKAPEYVFALLENVNTSLA